MKTKLLFLFLMLITSIGTILASIDNVGGIYYNFNINTLEAEVTYYGSSYYSSIGYYKGTINIPSSVTFHGKTYAVTSIGSDAFRECGSLTSVTIPNSVTSIGSCAFCRCYGLSSVAIGDSVINIGELAFGYCTSLTSVTVPNSVTSIGQGAFYNCTSLVSVMIPNSVLGIGGAAFSNCSDLTFLTIGNSVTSIGESAFNGCTSLSVILCKANNPPQCSSNAFDFMSLPASVVVYVPKGRISAYKKTATWKQFKNYQSNTEDQCACSYTAMTITIIPTTDVLRWEKSFDGGSTWTHIAYTDFQYTEDSPAAGTVLYRVLNTDYTYSDDVTITYVDAVPSTIQTLPATNTKIVEDSITFTADVVDNDYVYQWKKDGIDIAGANSRIYTIPFIKSSDAGHYLCYVSNGCNGVTTTTATLSVNKCAQTINFPEIPVLTYEPGLTYTLPETTDKGLTITYQSMNTSVATVNGNVLTIKAPGTAVISASQFGNDDYLEATQVSRKLTVNKRTQTITFDELPEKTYGDLPFTLPEKTNAGLKIVYTSSNTSIASVTDNVVAIHHAGTTTITASQPGNDYYQAATPVSQTLIVNKAPLTITALDATRKQNEANPKFELKIEGFKLEDTIADLDKLPTIQCEADVNSPAGTYPIVLLEDGYAANYRYNLINGVLTVESTEAVDNVSADTTPRKILEKGQILILRGEKIYTITGQEL